MARLLRSVVVATLAIIPWRATSAQTPIDSALGAYIASIRAIDNHAHPMLPVPPGAPADTDFDALPLSDIPLFGLPWRIRSENPEWARAQSALFGVSASSGDAFRTALHESRARELRSRGGRYAEWVLDRAGIDVMLANRIALGPGLAPPRFLWVAFADPLMLPLDTRGEAARTPDTRSLYPREDRLLRRYMRDLGVTKLPPTLDTYVATVLVPTLERERRAGAVAVKFEAAYLRPLDFGDADLAAARAVYARYAASGTPTRAEYKSLQDYLFRRIAQEAGRLGLSVHIHVTDGVGGFYLARGSAPHLLEPVFNDSTLRGTSFVLIHGGWPLFAQTQSMLAKPNVYADISQIVLFAQPREIANALRSWLTAWPEKVLFGTDAFDGGPDQGWEEVTWIGASTARRALAMALSGMLADGEVDRSRAEALARMVMRENAAALYHLAPAAAR